MVERVFITGVGSISPVGLSINETWSNLTFDPNEPNNILKQIGNQTTSITTEDGVSYVTPTGDYPNNSRFVRVSSLPDSSNTANYLDSPRLIASKVNEDTFLTTIEGNK